MISKKAVLTCGLEAWRRCRCRAGWPPARRRARRRELERRQDAELELEQEPQVEDENHDRQEEGEHEGGDDGDQRDGEGADLRPADRGFAGIGPRRSGLGVNLSALLLGATPCAGRRPRPTGMAAAWASSSCRLGIWMVAGLWLVPSRSIGAGQLVELGRPAPDQPDPCSSGSGPRRSRACGGARSSAPRRGGGRRSAGWPPSSTSREPVGQEAEIEGFALGRVFRGGRVGHQRVERVDLLGNHLPASRHLLPRRRARDARPAASPGSRAAPRRRRPARPRSAPPFSSSVLELARSRRRSARRAPPASAGFVAGHGAVQHGDLALEPGHRLERRRPAPARPASRRRRHLAAHHEAGLADLVAGDRRQAGLVAAELHHHQVEAAVGVEEDLAAPVRTRCRRREPELGPRHVLFDPVDVVLVEEQQRMLRLLEEVGDEGGRGAFLENRRAPRPADATPGDGQRYHGAVRIQGCWLGVIASSPDVAGARRVGR